MRLALAVVACICAACVSSPRPSSWSRAVTVVQRSSEQLELDEATSVVVTIDDITAGQVLARLTRADEVLVAQRSMRRGDAIEFELDGEKLTFGLSEMVNLLIGEDYARFHVGTDDAVAKAQIDAFLRRIDKARPRFGVAGSEISGEAMARRLRRDLERRRHERMTARRFLDEIAGKQRGGRSAYRVLVGNEPTSLAAWLRGDLPR